LHRRLLHRLNDALPIRDLTRVVSEIELANVAVQVLCRDVMVRLARSPSAYLCRENGARCELNGRRTGCKTGNFPAILADYYLLSTVC
jgi:hypothetical protein